MRRAGHEAFNEMSRDAEFHPTQTKEAVLLTDGLLRNDGGWEGELRRSVRMFPIRNPADMYVQCCRLYDSFYHI